MQASQLKITEVTVQSKKSLNKLPVPLVSSQLNIVLLGYVASVASMLKDGRVCILASFEQRTWGNQLISKML